MDDDLFPHRTPESVSQVVDLVKNDDAEVVEIAGVRVDHVAQHLGGHHHDVRMWVDGGVARQQAHLVGTIVGAQVAELLVAERLDGGRVVGLEPTLMGVLHRKLAHDRFARTGRGSHQH